MICKYIGRLVAIAIVLVFSACNNSEQSKDLEQGRLKADSLSIKLNSPELKAVNAALLKDASNDSLYRRRALIYLSLREFNEAVNDGKRAIRLDSAALENYVVLADIYFAQNNTRLSKELLEITVKKFPEDTRALLKLAELYFLVQRYQDAIDFVNKALRINENLAKGYFIKGSIYRESGDTNRAISSLETAIEQDAKMIDAHYDLGVIYAARRNPIAMEYYNNVLRLDPKRSNVRYARAKLLQDLGKTDAAITEYEAIIKDDPACANCHYNIGALYLQIKKDNKKALAEFSKTIEIDHNNIAAYLARGYTYSLLKDKTSARADYQMCLQLQPNYEPAVQALNEL